MIEAMPESNRENEIKLAYPSADKATAALRQAGATLRHERTFEDNTLFDLPGGVLAASDRILRLRSYGTRSILTFKGPVEGGHAHKVRVEHEMDVPDAAVMRSILGGLGYTAVYRYQKYRATYAWGPLEAAVDETPIGTFVELEGPPDDVDRAAAALGAAPPDYIRATYRELQVADASARGAVAGDMLMPEPSAGSRS